MIICFLLHSTSCTYYLLAAIKINEYSYKTVWALVWQNYTIIQHFAPYLGHASAANFIEFCNDSLT